MLSASVRSALPALRYLTLAVLSFSVGASVTSVMLPATLSEYAYVVDENVSLNEDVDV